MLTILKRGDKVVVQKVEGKGPEHITPFMVNAVAAGSEVFSDEGVEFSEVGKHFKHKRVNHQKKEYVVGNILCNGAENFHSIFKRGIYGVYHQVSDKHLDKYCNEYAFRYNYRTKKNTAKFFRALDRCNGRLTYAQLINK